MDNYFLDLDDPKLPSRDGYYPPYDVPDAYRLDELATQLKALSLGRDVAIPTYDLLENQRLPATQTIPGDLDYYFVKGLYAILLTLPTYKSPKQTYILDVPGLKIYVETAKDIRHARRTSRDRALWPDYVTSETIERNFFATERATDDLIAPQSDLADSIVDGS